MQRARHAYRSGQVSRSTSACQWSISKPSWPRNADRQASAASVGVVAGPDPAGGLLAAMGPSLPRPCPAPCLPPPAAAGAAASSPQAAVPGRAASGPPMRGKQARSAGRRPKDSAPMSAASIRRHWLAVSAGTGPSTLRAGQRAVRSAAMRRVGNGTCTATCPLALALVLLLLGHDAMWFFGAERVAWLESLLGVGTSC